MKIKKTRIKQLFKLHLLKFKVYEQSIKKTKFNDYNLNQIIVNIKKFYKSFLNTIKQKNVFCL